LYGAAQAVLRVLQPDSPMALDHLIEAVEGSSPSEIIAILFELELAGMVRQLPGKNFIKVWAD
jgi:DNA processing protein